MNRGALRGPLPCMVCHHRYQALVWIELEIVATAIPFLETMNTVRISLTGNGYWYVTPPLLPAD